MTQKQILLRKAEIEKTGLESSDARRCSILKNNRNGQSRLNWKKSSRVMLDRVKRP